MEPTSEEYVCQLVEAISIAQEQGLSLQDFLMDTAIEWVDCVQGKRIEKLIRQGISPMKAAGIITHQSKQ